MLIDLEPIPKQLKELQSSWEGRRQDFINFAKLAKEYYYNDVEGTKTNYTQQQVKKIESANKAVVSLNYIYPYVSQKAAILNQNKYSHRIITTDNRAKEVAYVMDKAKDLILNSSEALIEFREAILESLITGMSHVGWVYEDYPEDDSFGIQFMHIPIEYIILDPNSRKKSNLDMRGYFYIKKTTKDIVENIYNPYLETINSYYNKKYTIDDLVNYKTPVINSSRDNLVTSLNMEQVEVKKYYTKQIAQMYLIKNPESGIITREFRENYFPEQFDLILETSEVVDVVTAQFVKETTLINDKIIEIKMIPSRDFLLKTIYYEWDQEPYKSKGMVHFIVGMQQTVDKTIQELLYNASLLNAGGWTAPKGSISDEDRQKWEQDGAVPGVMKEYVPVVYENTVLKPEREQPPQLPPHFVQIIDLMLSSIKISTNITEVVTGDLTKKLDVFSTAQLYQTSAMYRISEFADYLNTIQAQMGKALCEILPSIIRPDKHYYFFNQEEDDFDEFAVTKDQLNTIVQSRFLVTAVPSALSPTAKNSMAIGLTNIAQTTQDPVERDVYIKHAYKLMDLRGFDQLKKDLETVQQQRNVIEQLQQQIERDRELIKQWENRVINAELKAEILRQQMRGAVALAKAEVAATKDTIIEKLESEIGSFEKL